MNGITAIKPFDTGNITKQDVFAGLLSLCGAKVSNMPENYISKSYDDRWELFNPAKVKSPEDLPEHWAMVYEFHNEPDRIDCVRFKYRYVHIPIDILPRYPRVPCKGIFCLDNDTVKIKDITAEDLIHIGNEFE